MDRDIFQVQVPQMFVSNLFFKPCVVLRNLGPTPETALRSALAGTLPLDLDLLSVRERDMLYLM